MNKSIIITAIQNRIRRIKETGRQNFDTELIDLIEQLELLKCVS